MVGKLLESQNDDRGAAREDATKSGLQPAYFQKLDLFKGEQNPRRAIACEVRICRFKRQVKSLSLRCSHLRQLQTNEEKLDNNMNNNIQLSPTKQKEGQETLAPQPSDSYNRTTLKFLGEVHQNDNFKGPGSEACAGR